jgi:hypothetical protein
MQNLNNLNIAKKNKSDEFYTLYEDIEKEINRYLDYNKELFLNKVVLCPCDDPSWSNFTRYFAQNFEKLGLKRLICTSYASNKKIVSLFDDDSYDRESPQYDSTKSKYHGKVFTLQKKIDTTINFDDLEWDYLEGDGDFRSQEVIKLRDESDIVITNPPFSLFREFVAWIMEAEKKFFVIGNINCIAYKEVFPLLMTNRAWLGTGIGRWISGFIVPDGYSLYGTEARINEKGQRIVSTNNCLWLTNIEHGKRHQPLSLMTLENNKKFSKHKEVKGIGYKKYDNYDAIDVPFTDAIPSDYEGLMGVPLTFMDKYCPEQFDIVGPAMGWSHTVMKSDWKQTVGYKESDENGNPTRGYPYINGKQVYHRILIKRR